MKSRVLDEVLACDGADGVHISHVFDYRGDGDRGHKQDRLPRE